MGDQLDQLTKAKAKMDKEKAALSQGVPTTMRAAADNEAKAKANAEKMAKSLEVQLNEAADEGRRADAAAGGLRGAQGPHAERAERAGAAAGGGGVAAQRPAPSQGTAR